MTHSPTPREPDRADEIAREIAKSIVFGSRYPDAEFLDDFTYQVRGGTLLQGLIVAALSRVSSEPGWRTIDSAPKDGAEFWSLCVTDLSNPDQGGGWAASIHLVHWDGDGFAIGSRDSKTNVGDGCGAHWLPLSALPALPPMEGR